jgi:hypothetical protein
MMKLISNKKDTSKDDGSSAMLLEMQKMQQEFNKKILEMQEARYNEQLKSIKRENTIKEEYEKVIEEKLSNITKNNH